MSESSGVNLAPTIRSLAVLSIPSVLIGAVSALVLFALDEVAGLLQHGEWVALPYSLGIDPDAPGWIFGVLSVTGLAVGLAVWLLPGHGGTDSATTELSAPPLRPLALPSLALVTVLALAGGVSLGPENPIIAINTGILVALLAKLWPRVPTALVVMITAAATLGAMFGTPVAAALVLTGMVGSSPQGGALWDRLFLPLVAAGAGSITTTILSHPVFSIHVGTYDHVEPIDLVSSIVIAAVATGIGILAAWVFPSVHRSFRLLRNPAIYVTAGGILLGVLGVIGGPITLFKGLAQMGELVVNRHDYDPGQLALIIVIKVIALVIAAAAGFRGGRIFPSVFIGAAIGILANAIVPGIPLPLAVASGILGVVLAVSRDGWVALFIAVVVTGSLTALPLLCVTILPIWLMVSRAPKMIVQTGGAPGA
ncbi:MAG TPA: ion channel protein [Galbitalea sp.]|jgi:H+/Cl- antiporter ClcA